MNNRHITLHSASDNSPIIIDAKIIIGAIKSNSFGDFSHTMSNKCTNIIVDTADKMDNYLVQESVEKVLSILNTIQFEDFGFIKLHEAGNNNVCVLNTNYIDTVYVESKVTTININENDVSMSRLEVNESPEKIKNAIMDLCRLNIEYIKKFIGNLAKTDPEQLKKFLLELKDIVKQI